MSSTIYFATYEWMNELMNEFSKIINDRMHNVPLWQETHDVRTKNHLFPSTCIGYGELRVMWGGEGPYELPPSRGFPCSVHNIKLFSK